MCFESEETRQWINNYLTKMLCQMNVQEEYAIAGRFWLSEITRMVRQGYKVIVVISSDVVTSHLDVMLNKMIFEQNSREPCFIPILFNCTLDDLHEHLKLLLKPYVLLKHNDTNIYDRLKQAIYD